MCTIKVALVLALCAVCVSANVLPTVPQLNVTAYMGRWYQVYSNEITSSQTQFNGTCVLADYGYNSPGNVSVHNWEHAQAPDGPVAQVYGYAVQNNPEYPGRLGVYFPSFGTVDAPYWVVQLGPQEYLDDPLCSPCYEYSVVSDAVGGALYVLARDPMQFFDSYNETVYDKLIQQGFTVHSLTQS